MIDTGGSGALDQLDEDIEQYLESPVQLLKADADSGDLMPRQRASAMKRSGSPAGMSP